MSSFGPQEAVKPGVDLGSGAAKPEEHRYSFPVIDKTAIALDNSTGVAWIGIPVKKMGLLDCWAFLDHLKGILLTFHKQMESPIVKPAIGSRMMDILRKGVR